MMKTPDEIKKGLRRCEDKSQCDWCSLIRECEEDEAALAYIIQLEQSLAQVESERDALKQDICEGIGCATCKHCDKDYKEQPCVLCSEYRGRFGALKWEWRGVCAENTKEE